MVQTEHPPSLMVNIDIREKADYELEILTLFQNKGKFPVISLEKKKTFHKEVQH